MYHACVLYCTQLRLKIVAAYNQPGIDPDYGLTLRQILEYVQRAGMSNANEFTVRQAIQALTDEGTMFSTVDDDHWGITTTHF
jgi:hypothetical protein